MKSKIERKLRHFGHMFTKAVRETANAVITFSKDATRKFTVTSSPLWLAPRVGLPNLGRKV